MSAQTKSYEAQLAEWKRAHGIDPTAIDPNELRMAYEEQQSTAKAWCLGCDQHLPVSQMKLITRRIDPYVQIDDGPTDYIAKANRVRMCKVCFALKYVEGICD